MNVDNQHVDATNILIPGSKLDWVKFGCRALKVCQINASSWFKEIPCRKTSERQAPSMSLCKHVWHGVMKKSFTVSACKLLLCNYFSLTFLECSGLQQLSYQMYNCKSVISCCCDIFPSSVPFSPQSIMNQWYINSQVGRFLGIPPHFLSDITWHSVTDEVIYASLFVFALVHSNLLAQEFLSLSFFYFLSNHLPPAFHGRPSDFGGWCRLALWGLTQRLPMQRLKWQMGRSRLKIQSGVQECVQ